jgi:molecular chaperone DnaK
MTASQKLGEKMYAEQAAGAAAGGAGAGAQQAKADDGNVVDAEYEEVDDKR